MNEVGMEVLLLEGGQGGKGNAAFANKWHHSPIESTRGLPGNTMLAQLELKSIADCGLIGYPNAGKSSLLSAISSSKPAVAPYAFTTLRPYIGVLHDLYGNTCRIADIPGLMEGAYENRGLGHQFLRHVERTKTLAFVVDMHSTYTPDPKEPSMEPWDVVALLQCELEYYLPNLSERAIMVFANKMDQEVDSNGRPLVDKLKELTDRVTLPVFPVSAALGIALGPDHKQAGLSAAIQFMCHKVFESKSSERQLLQKRRANEEMQLQKVFEYKNNGIFSFEDDEDHGDSLTESTQSLVDQQLDQLGFSGLGETFDGYEHSIARNKLHEYRDLTMKGKYWRLTRQKGESLRNEKWKSSTRSS
ncbi:GTP-binding protein [Strigomonas culicis]|uniref:GTP-binding protein n=1 Tax=Strigomonas culicis TaxID=28005 RepID=S9WMD8_9TRYP|nr:GTP-binding protein [Strigomonas culicis]|eukprot:EPY37105.1 GTP-binding protein [Strigomonas culicis]